MAGNKAIMAPPGVCRTDNEATQSLFASHGASKSLQANVSRILRSFRASPAPRDYEMTPDIKDRIVKWVVDYYYGNNEFPHPYAPNIARPLERTVEERIINEAHDEKLVAHIQSSGRFVKAQLPIRSVDGYDTSWSVFPRFYNVPIGYPINNIEERFAKLVGWQLACFQQRVTTLNIFSAKRLNAISGDWLFPEYINVDLKCWDDRSLYMDECYAALQQAEAHCESIIEDYLLKFVREANVFVDNVQNNVGETHDHFEDYKNMQLNNAICNTYGFLRKLNIQFTGELNHLKSSMLLAGDTASTHILQAAFDNKKRCDEMDWMTAFNWLGIDLSASLSMFMGCDKTREQQIKREANNPGSTGTPPPFNHVFFGRHKVFDFEADI